MALTEKQITLQECLQVAGIRALPKKITSFEDNTWIKAICLVNKIGGRQSYCLCDNDGSGKPAIKRDFGPCVAIVSIEEVYPYKVLDKKFMPDLRSDKQIVEYLSKNGYNESTITAMLDKSSHPTPESAKVDREKVKEYIYKAAIKVSQQMIAEEDRCTEIKNYASRIKTNGKDSKK